MIAKSVQLHAMLSPDEMASLRQLSDSLKMNLSSVIRLLIRAAELSVIDGVDPIILIDQRCATSLNRNIRALGHLLNQSTKALNTISKVVRESGVDAMDLLEELELVDYLLREIDREADGISEQFLELRSRKVLFG